MQRFMPIAMVSGAALVAGALVFHGCQLAEVTTRLDALESCTGALDGRLDTFSRDLPSIIEQAGHDAGRQVVSGVLDELYRRSSRWLWRSPVPAASSNRVGQARRPPEVDGAFPDEGIPLVRFNIPDTVFNIHILSNLKELPPLPWFAPATNEPPAGKPNPSPPRPPAS